MMIIGNIAATTHRAFCAFRIIYVLVGCCNLLRTSMDVTKTTTNINAVTAFAAFRSSHHLHHNQRCNNAIDFHCSSATQRWQRRERTRQQSLQHASSSSDDDDEFYDDGDGDDGKNVPEDDSQLFEDAMMVSGGNSDSSDSNSDSNSNSNSDSIMDELAWRTNKIRLEEQNDRRFQKALRSKPWKLPYEVAKLWVQKNLGAETKEEFEDLVLNGNLRTPYIPKDPKRYYTDKGTWLGWDDFLLL